MNDSTDRLSRLELAELMASKLCHDLVGPVGATANGAELLADMTMEDEALALTSASANQAAKLLQYFRLAFGAAGGLRNDFDELRSVVAGMAELRGLEHSWHIDAGVEAPLGVAKLLANLMGLAAEALPRSGSLEGGLRQEDGEIVIFATAKGPNALLREDSRDALHPTATGEITARCVQAYYAALLARQLDAPVQEQSEDGAVALSARLPASK